MSAATTLPRGRRRAAPLALGLGVLAVAAIAAVTLVGGDGKAPRRATAGGGDTAAVRRQTLVQREIVDGTLGYAGARTVINRLGSGSGDGGSPTGGSDRTSPAASSTGSAAAVAAVAFSPDQDAPEEDSEQPQDGEDNPEEPEGDDPDQPERHDPDQPKRDEPEQPEGDDREEPEGDGTGSEDEPTPRSSSPDSDSGSDPDSYSGSGTVTALPRAGSVPERGDALYRLDGDPIVLMYGSTPAYRTLESGIEDGRDVRQLEQNLSALGFYPGPVDETFTATTGGAVSDWQESVGLEATGAVELGRVVFLPGPRRVGERKTPVGSALSAGSEVLETSSTKRVVTVELDATLQSLARDGAGVEVTLPDGATVRGRIADIGRVARELESSSDDPSAEAQLVIDVTVELRSKRGLGRLDEAPVAVGLAQESRRHVLAVPVNALVARRGGGYGVELAAGRRIVPVEAGMFADGYIEISGAGIREGTRVVVPRG